MGTRVARTGSQRGMNHRLRYRLATLTGTFAGSLLLVAWLAHATWLRAVEVREHFRFVVSENGQLAERFQEKTHRLDSLLLRARLHHDPVVWQRFEADLRGFETWLAAQRPLFASVVERELFDQIDRELKRYLETVRAMARTPEGVPFLAAEMDALEVESDAMESLGTTLAAAHRTSAEAVLTRAASALQRIQWMTYAVLGLLAAAGGAATWLVYRDHIAPLQRDLDASRRALERSEKLAALGVLSAGVAHEIRNPLTALKARLFTLRKSVRDDPSGLEDLGMIEGELDRLNRIVGEFLNFARPPEPAPQIVDPAQLLEHVRTLTAPVWISQGVKLELAPGTAPAVVADPHQINQALLNLVRNAAEAMPGGGVVRLSARSGERLPDGRAGVALEIDDNGPGMRREVQARIFDPFFTTKPNGTGLGLSLTARLVEGNGGTIRCSTAAGRGTTFTVVLPRAEE